MNPGVLYFSQKITDFIRKPLQLPAHSSPAYVLYKALGFYDVPLLKDCSDGNYTDGTLTYIQGAKANSGSYGSLYFCTLTSVSVGTSADGTYSDSDVLFLKVSKNKEVSLKNEAILQHAAHILLAYHGMPWAVPRVHTIVDHPHHGVAFTMDMITDAVIFGDYLVKHINWKVECVENDMLIMEVISQLASYIMLLETGLGLNHRDLKINNVLMVKEDPLVNHTIVCDDGEKYVLNSRVRTVLIDFGFACIGDVERRVMYASAGNYLAADMCPKPGRDMFLIFANLWNVAALRRVLTVRGRTLFKKWLTDDLGKDWALWLSADLDKELLNIYKLVNGTNFRSTRAGARAVLNDIGANYPAVVKAPIVL
jgi:serine/threonine protein kinase